jgi:hypothetical protein
VLLSFSIKILVMQVGSYGYTSQQKVCMHKVHLLTQTNDWSIVPTPNVIASAINQKFVKSAESYQTFKCDKTNWSLWANKLAEYFRNTTIATAN